MQMHHFLSTIGTVIDDNAGAVTKAKRLVLGNGSGRDLTLTKSDR
jgi:hypothetical protein